MSDYHVCTNIFDLEATVDRLLCASEEDLWPLAVSIKLINGRPAIVIRNWQDEANDDE